MAAVFVAFKKLKVFLTVSSRQRDVALWRPQGPVPRRLIRTSPTSLVMATRSCLYLNLIDSNDEFTLAS
ncbi:hypothetical protein O3G_MSEX006943, partial [Manduca sexta]